MNIEKLAMADQENGTLSRRPEQNTAGTENFQDKGSCHR